MRNILLSLLLLMACISVTESLASQTRPPATMSPEMGAMFSEICNKKCTDKTCSNWDDNKWCHANCAPDPCSGVTPIMNNESDVNNASNAKKTEILENIYKNYGLVKPLLDESIYSKSGDEYWRQNLDENQNKQLASALTELDKECQAVLRQAQVSSIKSYQPHNFSQPLIENIQRLSVGLRNGIYAIENNKNLPIKPRNEEERKKGELEHSRKRVKQAIAERVLLSFKTCINQGFTAKFQLEQKPKQRFGRSVMNMFSCSHCSDINCGRSVEVYARCSNRCPASKITDCAIAAAKCPVRGNPDTATCNSIHNQFVQHEKCVKCTKAVCSTLAGYEACIRDCPVIAKMPQCIAGADAYGVPEQLYRQGRTAAKQH